MPEYQTSVQDVTAIVRGSGKVSLSVWQETPSWVNVGAIQGLEVSEDPFEVNKEENDNTDSDEIVTKQGITIKGTMLEGARTAINDIIRLNFDTVTTTPASKVNDYEQTVLAGSWDFNTFVEFTKKNTDGTCPQIDSTGTPTISGSTDGPLVNETDFFLGQNELGVWGFFVIDSATVTTISQNLTVTYDYTPAASKLIESGNMSILPWFIVKIETLNDGTPYTFEIYKCKIKKGKTWKYKKDDDTDRRMGQDFEFIGHQDATYHADTDGVGKVYGITQEGGIA